MAVPKKRRIGYKLLNRGFKQQRWHAKIWNRTFYNFAARPLKAALSALNPLMLLQLKKINSKKFKYAIDDTPRSVTSCSSRKGAQNLIPAPFPFTPIKSRLLQMLKKKVFKFSAKAVYWKYPNRVRLSYVPQQGHVLISRSLLNFSTINFFLKQYLLGLQVSHTWGSQRRYLLKAWEVTPSYLSFNPLSSKTHLLARSQGILTLGYPLNLTWPTGPTLKDLWVYIKTNPNEGYWMYCMWLQIFKKWKRWWSFPHKYLIFRNIWQRQAFKGYFYVNLAKHCQLNLKLKQFWIFQHKPYFRISLFCKPYSLITYFATKLLLPTFFRKKHVKLCACGVTKRVQNPVKRPIKIIKFWKWVKALWFSR